MPRLRKSRPYVSPGYRRVRRGTSFRYETDAKTVVSAEERARVTALVIPPAWTNVWIAEAPNSHILAVGVDDAGRRQYIYHPDWRKRKDQDKFLKMQQLAAALPSARRAVTRDLRTEGLTRVRVRAAAFRILDTVAIRVGGEEYALEHGSHGLTTLLRRHAKVDGTTVTLKFPSKSGQRAEVTVTDVDLSAVLRELHAGSGAARLFAWREDGAVRRLGASEVNDYIAERTGGSFTAKDFRTLKGTVTAALELARIGPGGGAKAHRQAVVAASEELGNTPTIAKNSYIDPTVFDRYEAGEVIDRSGAPEPALLKLLN